jgi:Ca2+-binding RTX toxin-like protein
VTLINSGVAETVRNFERLLFQGDGVLRELVTVPAIVGTEGNDGWLQGGSGADLLRGLGGDDMLVGRGGADTLDGGSGYDHAAFGGSFPGSRFERQADGSVLATTSDGVDRLINIEAVWFSGDGAWRSIKELVGDHGTTGSDNWVEGTAGADKLYGLAGDDLLVGRGGDDVLNGGPGWDTAYYAGLSYNVTFERQEDGSVLVYGYEGVDRLIDMEAVWFHTHQEWRSVKELVGDFGTAGADPWIQGTRFNDRLFGLGGDDILVGSPGNDLIDGGAGYDSVIYHASRSDFRIERRADGAVLVTDIRGDGGADVLIGVEGMWFAHDGTWFETAWLL